MKSPTPHLDDRTGKLILKDYGRIGQPSLFIFEREVWLGIPDADGSIGGSYAGVTAEVLTQGQITQRLTATRMLTLGVFALAVPKKSGNQTVLLSVTGDGFMFTFESGAVESMKMRLLNTYAQRINNIAKTLPTPTVASAPSVADEIERFADLHARGILTDEEFAAKKAQLLA